MDINDLKLKIETILDKSFILRDLGNGNFQLIEDAEKEPLEFEIGDSFGELSIKIKERVYSIEKFIQNISSLQDKNISNEEFREIYVNFLGADKRLIGNEEDKIKLIEEGKYLEILINDENWYIRRNIAKQRYKLEKLINDKHWEVRATVAEQGYGLDKLINDENSFVRRNIAKQGYGLDKLVNDESGFVRKSVAEKGYGLDKLINDEDYIVEIVNKWLNNHNITIQEYIQNKDYWYNRAMEN